jgi:hypothetical protein
MARIPAVAPVCASAPACGVPVRPLRVVPAVRLANLVNTMAAGPTPTVMGVPTVPVAIRSGITVP